MLLLLLFAFPVLARAQGAVEFSSFNVQLLPEYDQPSMLVIYDFALVDPVNIPASLDIRIPAGANLFAVAYNENGNLINAEFNDPVAKDEWQVVTIVTNGAAAFRIEYYESFLTENIQRQYTFLWPGDYAVQNFNVFLSKPLDAARIAIDPSMQETRRETDGLAGFEGSFGNLAAGKQFILLLKYEKSTDALVLPPPEVEPSAPVDENTPGRISLENYLPYLFGGLGLIFIFGGIIYYWRTNRKPAGKSRRKHRGDPEGGSAEIYCHQCGARAKSSDRFCRVCGSRLRQDG